MKIVKDGNAYCVMADNFVDLQESSDYFFIDKEEYRKMDEWIRVEDGLPTDRARKLLVTNNIKARNAHEEMSHLWLVTMIHESQDPRQGVGFSSFDECGNKILSITHWRYALPKESN